MNTIASVFLAALLLAPLAELRAADDKPNLLVILTDDQRYDCLGSLNPHIQTPNMDRLARQGVLFRNCYIMGGDQPAVCTPSRTMLMSGRTLFHLPNDIKAPGNKPSVPVMSTVFRAAGYDTFYCGKHGNTYHPADCSFDTTVFINRTKHEQIAQFHSYTTHVIDCLSDPARAKKPFFIFYAPSIPHDPVCPEPQDVSLYSGSHLPPLPSTAAVDHQAVAGFNLHDTNIRSYVVPGLGHFKTPLDLKQWPDVLARYYAFITSLDRQLGLILDKLEQTGAAKSTLIVFASDNGLSLSDLGLIHKESVYEEDVRVPLIVCGPGIPAGKRSEAMVYLSDVFPTLCERLGVPTPKTVETKSFLPALLDPARPHRQSMYFGYRDEMRAYRDDRYKIMLFDNRRVRLFDLKTDPFERHDLSREPTQSERVTRMIAQAREAGKALGEVPAGSRFWTMFGRPSTAP